MRFTILTNFLLILHTGISLAQTVTQEQFKYLQQAPPGLTAKVFAPDIVSTEDYEFGSVFSKNGKESFYAVIINGKAQIRYMKLEKNTWTKPVTLLFSDTYEYNDPFLSPDEKKLFFISDRAMDGKGAKKDIDIWYVERKNNGWSDPVNAGKEINSDKNEYYISFTKEGTMYFSSNTEADAASNNNFDIYYSKFTNNAFQSPQKLSTAINSKHYEADVFISPDESYIIFCAERPDGFGQGDLYISFKNAKGEWQQAKNMGKAINTPDYEFCPFVSGDGKFLFYSSKKDIYWIDAKIINTLR